MIRNVTRYPKDDGYTYVAVVFSGNEARLLRTDERALDAAESFLDGFERDGYYGGPGRPFAHRANVRRSRTRVLVYQTAGLDV